MSLPEEIENGKCVIVVNDALPLGLAINAATVVAFTLGQQIGRAHV